MWSLFKARRQPKVTVISKTVCPLCDEALELIEELRQNIPIELEVKKIDDDPALYELHKYEVPVIFVDGRKHFFGKIQKPSLERVLKIASRRSGSD